MNKRTQQGGTISPLLWVISTYIDDLVILAMSAMFPSAMSEIMEGALVPADWRMRTRHKANQSEAHAEIKIPELHTLRVKNQRLALCFNIKYLHVILHAETERRTES